MRKNKHIYPHGLGCRCLGMCSLLNLNLFLTPTLTQLQRPVGAPSSPNCRVLITSLNSAIIACQHHCLFAIHAPHSLRPPSRCWHYALFPLGSDERQIMRLFTHYLPQLLHAHGLRHQDVEDTCSLLSQGKWWQLWDVSVLFLACYDMSCIFCRSCVPGPFVHPCRAQG